jgi:hypothetical protein
MATFAVETPNFGKELREKLSELVLFVKSDRML